MDTHDFLTLSTRWEMIPAAASAPQDVLRQTLGVFRKALKEAGCTMIGHIKGILEDGASPPLFFSITSLDGDVQLKGGPLKEGELILNITVIVAGLEKAEVEKLLTDTFAEHFQSAYRPGE
jgi:hypothetical protein